MPWFLMKNLNNPASPEKAELSNEKNTKLYYLHVIYIIYIYTYIFLSQLSIYCSSNNLHIDTKRKPSQSLHKSIIWLYVAGLGSL